MKSIKLSNDLYDTIQKLKEVFLVMNGDDSRTTMTDEEVISILVGGLIDSFANANSESEDDANQQAAKLN